MHCIVVILRCCGDFVVLCTTRSPYLHPIVLWNNYEDILSNVVNQTDSDKKKTIIYIQYNIYLYLFIYLFHGLFEYWILIGWQVCIKTV